MCPLMMKISVSIDDDSEQLGDQPSMTRVLYILRRNDETSLCIARTTKTYMCVLMCRLKCVFFGDIGYVIVTLFFVPCNTVQDRINT